MIENLYTDDSVTYIVEYIPDVNVEYSSEIITFDATGIVDNLNPAEDLQTYKGCSPSSLLKNKLHIFRG